MNLLMFYILDKLTEPPLTMSELNNTDTKNDPPQGHRLIESYKSGLFLFGWIKVIKGRPLEKVFWAISMILIISFITSIVYENTRRYFNYDVRTEVRNEEKAEKPLPVITLCLESTLKDIMNCYNNDSLYPNALRCKTDERKTNMFYYDGILTFHKIPGRHLSNGCYVFNENGTISISGKEYQEVHFNVSSGGDSDSLSDALLLIFQSPKEFQSTKSFFHVTRLSQYLRLTHGVQQIEIREKRYSRLKFPYQSNCSDETLVQTNFSTKYTYNSCQETCAYNNMYRECKDVLDIWKKLHPITKNPFINSTYRSRKDCLRALLGEALFKTLPHCACSPACEEITYTADSRTANTTKPRHWRLLFYHRHAVTTVKLHPDYPLGMFFGSFGGVLGLGSKFMTTLQLFVFLTLCIWKLVKRE